MTDTNAGDRPTEAAPTSEPTGARPTSDTAGPATTGPATTSPEGGGAGGAGGGSKPRRRGSRGGRNRNRPRPEGGDGQADAAPSAADDDRNPDLPPKHRQNMPTAEAGDAALVRRPRIGDTRPAPPPTAGAAPSGAARPAAGGGGGGGGGGATGEGGTSSSARRRRRRGGRGRGGQGGDAVATGAPSRAGGPPVTAITDDAPVELDETTMRKRRGRERNGRAVGRYLMAVHVQPTATQIAVLEGKALIEHYVSRPSDDISQIHGNIYLGKVQNVLPGMEAAFVDIGTPKNAVLYRGDTRYDAEDVDVKGANPRIEEILKARQTIVCQVTKNPIGAKGARLTQEISLPGRFVVLVPNSTTYGISKRLPDQERKRLRQILDKAKPKGHGLIVRTAAEGISAEELQRDVERLAQQWEQIEALAAKSQAPTLLYRDPDMSIRVIREEFNQDYRQVVIDDDVVFEQVRDYVRSISPALVERVERYDPAEHGNLPIFETYRVHEQLHKALDRKVWLPSGGSLIIERTEALTVIDVNTGKNVGKSSLEETVFRNNLEAAEEVARQLRLRDIGGIIVIDFIDMEVKANREQVIATFRQALARDKTRTQVFDISELGLVEMTRKRIGEGLIESLSAACPTCEGRGLVFDQQLLGG
jgi:ribonuclease E